MIKRTTDEWEALLDGTTPGPWVRSESAWEPHDVRTADQERWVAMTKDGDDGVDKDALADTHLIAAAPEVVAEVVRLRRELEELRDHYIDREARSRERLESVTDEREQFHLARFAHMHKRTHEALARILEGDNDE